MFSPTRLPSTPRASSRSHISQAISAISKHQQKTMSTISEKCSSMEYTIASLEIIVSKLGQKCQKLTREKEVEMMGTLKMKQNEFIIGELKNSLNKQLKKEQRSIEQLDCERRKVQKYREQVFKLQAKNNSSHDKINRLEGTIKEKDEQMNRLAAKMQKMKQ